MRIALAVLILTGLTVGDVPWRQNEEYVFGIYSRTLTALPDLKEQYVGVITKGELVLQVKSVNKIVGRLVNCVHAHFHDILENGVDTEIPDEILNYQESGLNNKPFVIEVHNGFIKSISVDQSLSNDQVNHLKAILSQLQVDVNGKNLIQTWKENQLPKNEVRPQGVFKVMEPTVTGMCETIYDIKPVQDFQVNRLTPSWTHYKNIKNLVRQNQPIKMQSQEQRWRQSEEHVGNWQKSQSSQESQEQFGRLKYQHQGVYGQQQQQQQQQEVEGQQQNQQIWRQTQFENMENLSPEQHSFENVERVVGQSQENIWGLSFFEIVKTINYNNCVQTKGYNFGIKNENDLKVFSNKAGEFLTRSAVTKVLARGTWNDFTIVDCVTTNRISVSPDLYQNQKAQVISQIQLRLLEHHAIQTNLVEPKQLVNLGNLVYSYNLVPNQQQNLEQMPINQMTENEQTFVKENWREEVTYQSKPNLQMPPQIPFYHYNVGNRGQGIHTDPKINLEVEVYNLVKEITQDVLVQDEITSRNTLEKFDILCDLIRVLSQQQIVNIYKQFETVKDEQNEINLIQKKVFHDAVAQAGTGPAVSVVCKWIIDQTVKGIEARDLIQDTCKNVQTPTDEVIRTIFNLIKHEDVKKREHLHSTALLSFTNLIRHAQVNKNDEQNRFPVHVFGYFHDQLKHLVVNEIIPYLGQCLQESLTTRNDQNTLVYLRALGNIAHPEILNVYEKLMQGGVKLTQFQRTALVLSLNKLVKVYPDLARRILFKIYTNIAEAPQTRSVAVLLLLRCHPTVEMLQHLAESTHDDPSEAVRSIIKSGIETCSQLKSKKWKNLSENCKAVRDFVTKHHFGDQYSKTYLRDYVAREMNLVYSHQLTHIVGEDNIVPQITLFQAYENLGGFKNQIVEMQAMVSTVEELVKFLPNCHKGFCLKPTTYYTQHKQEEVQQQQYQQYQKQFDGKWSINNIARQLNIEPELAKRLEGQFLLNFLGRKGFYTFDAKSLKELPQKLISTFSLFKEGEKLNYNKLYLRNQVVIAFPLVTGYPFIYSFRQPQLLQALGQVHVKTTPDIVQQPSWETIQNLESFNINANVHLVYSTNQIAKTGFITPFDWQRYVAGHVRKVHTHLPLSFKFDINLKTSDISFKVTPIDTKKDFYLLQSGAWPFTLRKDVFNIRPAAETKDLKVIQTRQPQIFNKVIGEKTTGMAFQLQVEDQFRGEHTEEIEKSLWKQGILSLARIPLCYHHLLQHVMNHEGQSVLSFVPFFFQERMNGNFLSHVISNLVTVPLVDETNVNTIIKNEGLWSLLTLPFADKQTLKQTVNDEGILTLGGWPWPVKSLDHYKHSLKYDATRSVNHIIKFSLKTDVIHNVNEVLRTVSNKVQGSTNVSEEKLAYAKVTTPDSEQRRLQFIENAAYGIKGDSVAVIDASIVFDGQSRAEYVATLARGQSSVDEKDRLLVFLNSSPMKKSENKQVCVSYVGKFPQTRVLDFEQALKQDKKSNIRVHFAYGEKCETAQTRVQVNVDLDQSPEYKQMVKNSQIGQRCLIELKKGNKQLAGCIAATYNANLLDTVAINVNLQNPTPKIQDFINSVLKTIRRIGMWNLHETVGEKVDTNKMLVVLKLRPIMNNEDKWYDNAVVGMDNVDILLDFGGVKQLFSNVHINKIWRPLLSIHPIAKIEDRVTRGAFTNDHICTVDQNKILTFDNHVIQHQIGNCWHAVVHFSNLQSQFNTQSIQHKDISVLVRQANNVNQKELLVTCKSTTGVDHIINLIPTTSSVQLKVNGNEQNMQPNQSVDIFDEQQDKKKQRPLIHIQKLLGNEVRILIRGNQMKILYDGTTVRVHVNPSIYRGNVRGLCGAFKGEVLKDMITPRQCVVTDSKLFTTSWIVDSSTCGKDVQQLKSVINQMKCDKVKFTVNNIAQYWVNQGVQQTFGFESASREQKIWQSSSEERKQYNVQRGNINYGFGRDSIYHENWQEQQPKFYGQIPNTGMNENKQWGFGQSKQSSEEKIVPTQRHQEFFEQKVQQQLPIHQQNFSGEQKHSGEQLQINQEAKRFGSSEESHQVLQQNKCLIKHQIHYVQENDQICFTKNVLNKCPVNCKKLQMKVVEAAVYCRSITDPVTQSWIELIHNGQNPDLNTVTTTKTITLNVPVVCVH